MFGGAFYGGSLYGGIVGLGLLRAIGDAATKATVLTIKDKVTILKFKGY